MAETKLSLVELKQLIRQHDNVAAALSRSFSCFPEGLPQGKIVELAGTGKTEFVARFLSEHRELKCAWVEHDLTVNPFALWQRGVNLPHVLFIDTLESRWATQQVLQSQLFDVVVLGTPESEDRELRKYQLMVEKTEGHLVIMNDDPQPHWAISLQLEMIRGDRVHARVLKRRGAL